MVEYGPGTPLYDYGKPYDFERHLREYGNGDNLLRTSRLAQVRALKTGDVLATGTHVLSDPQEGKNGSVLLHLDTGKGWFGTWFDVPARIPIALFIPGNKPVTALHKGDIIATGDQVLSEPSDNGNGSIHLLLTGGTYGHDIDVPKCIPIAILTPEDNAPKALWDYHKENNPE